MLVHLDAFSMVLLIYRLVFLREFRTTGVTEAPAPAASTKPNGAAWKGKGKDKKYTANAPFIPENVYDAMKETKRFESLSVSRAPRPLPCDRMAADYPARSPRRC